MFDQATMNARKSRSDVLSSKAAPARTNPFSRAHELGADAEHVIDLERAAMDTRRDHHSTI